MTMNTDFDAIVIGSGISGGWAAKELCEKGLKTLVLERGRPLQHGSDYLGEHAPPWKLEFHGKPDRELDKKDYEIQSQVYAYGDATRQFWNKDSENPYDVENSKEFLWHRGDRVGGRSTMWGRQSYRWSAQDFEANAKDGYGVPWPVSYDDIAPWYSYVEKFAGINGRKEGLPQLPDGEFQKPMPWLPLEETIEARLKKKAPDVTLTSARTAILTEQLGDRAACHYCGACERGCSTGSYFSSQSSTLPAAEATGNMTLMANMVVERLAYDPDTGKLSHVEVIDRDTRERKSFSARIFFLCASTVGSTQILLHSTSAEFPNGLANSSGVLGRYLMDHTLGTSGIGLFVDHMDSYYSGERPTGLYIPRFRNLEGQEPAEFLRGYGYQTGAQRIDWRARFNQAGIGAKYKDTMRKPWFWAWGLSGFGENLPQKRNRLYLSSNKKDSYGIPQVVFDMEWGDNDRKIREDASKQATRLLRAAGAALVLPSPPKLSRPGEGIHEMGTARMADDPREAVLNKYNQAHDVPNLFISDGSFMTSSSCVNPSLTYMAFTARAADYAVKQFKAGVI
jgi:choline dehydrogenase-like flavoprotein